MLTLRDSHCPGLDGCHRAEILPGWAIERTADVWDQLRASVIGTLLAQNHWAMAADRDSE